MDSLKDGQVKPDQYNYRTAVICELLRTGRIAGSVSCAKYTAKLVDLLVDIGDRVGKYQDYESLVERLKELRSKLQSAGPEQVAITNLILRVLHLIRTECSNAEHDPEAPESTSSAASPDQPQTLHQPSPPLRSFGRVVSLSNIMEQPLVDAARASVLEDLREHEPADTAHETVTTSAVDQFASLTLKEGKEQDAWPHKETLQSALKELFAELEDVDGQVASHSTDHILNNHKILTHGFDETVLRVLKEAKKKQQRKFSVYVTMQEPHNSGRLMAASLTAAGINTVLIRDHDIGNVMSRMDQVFLGVHCFLANGAVVARNGARPVALMAAARKVPVLAFGGHHKLTPVFMEDNPRSNVEPSLPMFAYSRFPAAVVCPEGVDSRSVSQRASMYDVVASRHVTLLVTDVGTVQPEFLPMLLPDFYCREDFALAMQA